MDETTLARFETKYVPEPNSGCWLWLGILNNKGYGRFNAKYDGKKGQRYAHRVSYAHYKGLIPKELELDHLCRTPCCVNPEHLEAVTHAENLRRGNKGHITKPENLARGDANGARKHPERMTRGDKHWARTSPELLARGDRHYSKIKPELVSSIGSKNPKAKLTEAQVLEIRALAENEGSPPVLAATYGVSVNTICSIINRQTWRHI